MYLPRELYGATNTKQSDKSLPLISRSERVQIKGTCDAPRFECRVTTPQRVFYILTRCTGLLVTLLFCVVKLSLAERLGVKPQGGRCLAGLIPLAKV